MKFKDLQKLDQDIIMALSSHKGIDRAIHGKTLAQSLKIDLRTLQSRIELAYHAHNKIHQNRHVLTTPCVEKC